MQSALAHDRVVGRRVAVGFLVVDREVLDLSHLLLALDAVDVRHGHRGVEIGIFGEGLERPTPARVPVDVDGRPKVDHGPLGTLLRAHHLSVLLRQRGVEGGGQRHGRGHLRHSGEAVADAERPVLLTDRRDAQARDRRNVEDVRFGEPGPGHHVGLVGERHLLEQHLHPLLNGQGLVEPRARRAGRGIRGRCPSHEAERQSQQRRSERGNPARLSAISEHAGHPLLSAI